MLKSMFDVDIDTYKMPRTVILEGSAGIGKTTLLRKAMLEWADGKLYRQFTYAFYLSGREISQEKEKSFAQLISKNWPPSEGPIEQILSKYSNLLFIIDSFDELDFSFEEPEFALCKDWTQKHPVSFLISSLLRKVMLPKSFLLVTARSTAWKRLMPLLQNPHCVKFPGLSKNARIGYIRHLLKDKTWAMEATCSIRRNERLFNMCHVWHVLQTICSCLKEQVEKGDNVAVTCQTTTALFTCYICSLFSQMDKSSVTLPNETIMRNLCQAAAEGIWTMKHMLYKKNLRKHELTTNDISVFLDMKVLQKDREYQNCYAFTHLHVQEFFAALFYFLKENPEENDHPIQPFDNLHLLLESDHLHDPHLEQMKCFLFGLLNKDRVQQLEETFKFTIPMDIKGELLMGLEALEKDDFHSSELRLMELFHYLYETQDKEFITQALSYFPKIAVKIEEETQLFICSFCLKHCCSLQTIKLTAMAKLKNKVDLDHIAETCLEDSVYWTDWTVTDYWKDLFSVLHTNESLREMNLYESSLDESLMKILSEELSHPKCKLQKLLPGEIGHKMMGIKKELIVDFNECTLRVLSEKSSFHVGCPGPLLLESCDLNRYRCLKLSEALCGNRSLVFLNLSTNNLTNHGVSSLCKVLGNPACCIERLCLASCGITKAMCEVLSLAITQSKRLTHLSLADNFLEDEGIKLLSNALRYPQCTLQSLVLRCCSFTSIGSEFLSTALLNNRNLVHLDLGYNRLEDSGIKLLCYILQQPTCALQELELMGCVLQSEGCLDLAFVLANNPNLWSLDLGNNNIKDAGLHILCDALKSSNCHIRRLGLENCGLTHVCCQDLLSLFTNSQSLIQINLMKNAFSYNTIRNFCKVLRSPSCKIKFIADYISFLILELLYLRVPF
ncbi:NACHT, LRR and PYD domains-containing protein 14 [Sigmodon hispidus]